MALPKAQGYTRIFPSIYLLRKFD